MLVDMRRWFVAFLAVGALFAAQPPAVPDPYGLGERLALIDTLQETYGIRSQPGVTLEVLRVRYTAAWSAAQAHSDDARARDARQRLRDHLQRTYNVVAAEDASEAALTAQLHIAQSEAASARGAALAEVLIRELHDQVGTAPRATPTAVISKTSPAAKTPDVGAVQVAPIVVTNEVVPRSSAELCAMLGDIPAKVTMWAKGDRGVLCVQFGPPGGVDFDGACQMIESLISQSDVGVKRAAFLIGHGGGTDVGGTNLEKHLSTYRTIYETVGGTLAAKPLDCLILASCSKGATVQMRSMRDGLGYYPAWRVCTGHRTYANVPTVVAASLGALSHRVEEGFRGSYRWNDNGVEAASTAEVGEGSKSGNLEVFRVSVKDGRLEITPQR
jgi:hypothetical protein